MFAALSTAVLAVLHRWEQGVPHRPGLLLATWLAALLPKVST